MFSIRRDCHSEFTVLKGIMRVDFCEDGIHRVDEASNLIAILALN